MTDHAICILAGISFVKFKRLCCDEHSNACISKVERRNVGIEIHEEKQTAADVAGVTWGKKSNRRNRMAAVWSILSVLFVRSLSFASISP